MRFWIALVVYLCPPRCALATPPIEGQAQLMQVLLDAQATNAAAFARGALDATCEEQSGSRMTRAEARVVWDGPRTYWESSLTRIDRESQQVVESTEGVRMIETPDEFIWYSPDNKLLQRIPDRSRTYDRTLRMRPDQSWFVFEPHYPTPWSDVLDPTFAESAVESIAIRRDGDRVIVERRYDAGMVASTVVSLSQGGNVIEYHWTAQPDPPEGVFPYARRGEYQWTEDARGEWYLRELNYSQFLPGEEDDPGYLYRLTVHEYDPHPEIPRDRFEMASLNIAPGTKVQEFGPRPRSYQFGQADDIVPQDGLDGLAEKLRQRGFAVPPEQEETQ